MGSLDSCFSCYALLHEATNDEFCHPRRLRSVSERARANGCFLVIIVLYALSCASRLDRPNKASRGILCSSVSGDVPLHMVGSVIPGTILMHWLELLRRTREGA